MRALLYCRLLAELWLGLDVRAGKPGLMASKEDRL